MRIYETAVKKPISTLLIFIGIMVVGLFSYTRLAVDLYPDIEMNQITVITNYRGASASDVETNVTRPLENMLNTVDDLKKLSSKSKENISLVTLEFEYGTDINVATSDVRDKIDMVKGALPDGVDQPIIFKLSTDMIPVIILSATATESVNALYKILDEKVVSPLNRINGVGAVSISGAPKRQIQVYVSPDKLEAYNLTIEKIADVIAKENMNIPAGSFDIGTETYSLRVEGEFKDSDQLNNIVVGSDQGRNVYLKDVAKVIDATEEKAQESFTNGVQGASIVVQKQSGSNTVDIAQQIRKKIPELQASLPPDIQLSVVMDTSEFIEASITSLVDSVMYAGLFVIVVVIFFLGRWRATFIIILTVPMSLIGSFIYLMATGGTLNIISLSSLSIAIGMVVDDAIVVLENITKHIERGSTPKEAAIYATNEVAVAVVASTLTIVAVFFPLTLVTGLAGVMFKQLGWTVTIVVSLSTLVALTLTPMLCSQLLKNDPKQGKVFRILYAPIEKFLDWLDKSYARLLNFAVRHRISSMLFCLFIFLGTLFLARDVKTEFLAAADNDQIAMTVELPAGARVELSRKVAFNITELIKQKYPELETITYTVGQADDDDAYQATQDNSDNLISFRMKATPANERDRSIFLISDELRHDLANIPELKRFEVKPGGGGGMGTGASTVDVEIYGYDLDKTDKVANDLKRLIEANVKGLRDIQISREDYKVEYQIDFDREKLALNGLNSATVANYVRNRINGAYTSKYREDGDEYDIVVRYDDAHRQSLEDIENILVYTPAGNPIRVRELGTIVERFNLPVIERQDRERVVTVKGEVYGAALSEVVDQLKTQIKKLDVPSGVSLSIAGSYEDQQESFNDMFLLLMLCIMLVYIVMAAQFESFSYPFIIMTSLPFGFSGVVLALLIAKQPLDLMGLIGAVMLVGIVVKNGIVLIDYVNLNRERGMSIITAVVNGGRSRLRPVLMTTATTVLGMIPLAIGTGQGSEMWRNMGIAIIGGLSFSTIITLIIVPVLYAVFGRNGVVRQRRKLEKLYAKRDKGQA